MISRHERRLIDSIPWSMQTSFYPMDFADRGAELLRRPRNIDEGAVKHLADTLHIRRSVIAQDYRAYAERYRGGVLRVPADGRVAMYDVTRTAYDGNGQPMRLTATVCPADRNQFLLNVGQVPPLPEA